MALISFLASTAGRWVRAIAGVALIVIGIVAGQGWLALVAVGIVFIAAGAFDFCLLAPLFGKPLSGKKIRESAK